MRPLLLWPVAALLVVLSGCAAVTPVNRVPPRPGPEGPQDAAALFTRGQQAAKRGDAVRAEQYLSLAIERGYDRAKVLPVLLPLCLSGSRLRAALSHAEPYLWEHPEDRRFRYLVANIHVGLGQQGAARVHLTQILEQDAAYAGAHYLLGILDTPVDVASAAAHFRAYLRLAPRGEHAAEVRGRLSELAIRRASVLKAGGSGPLGASGQPGPGASQKEATR